MNWNIPSHCPMHSKY